MLYISALNNAINVKIILGSKNVDRVSGRMNCEIPCEFFINHERSDAELYIVWNDDDVRSAVVRNSKVPIRILGAQEPQHYYHLLKLEYLKHHFQGSALLDRKSDIPWLLIGNMDKLKDVSIPKDAQPKATFVARNCNSENNRNDYVRAIDAKIGVVAPSICLNNAEWPDCKGTPCSKVEALRQYKIHLAFENGDSPGYISEKIYHAFEAGVLPVWLGTRDIAEAVPKGSYIDVAEFDTPHDVANYLKLVLENETLYNSYFEWKKKPFDPEYVRNNRVLWTDYICCRICYYVDSLQRGLEWDHQRQRAKSPDDKGTIAAIYLSDTESYDRHSKRTNKQLLNMFSQPNRNQVSSLKLLITVSLLVNSLLLFIIFRRKLFSRVYYLTSQ